MSDKLDNSIKKSFDFSIESLLRSDKDKELRRSQVHEDLSEDVQDQFSMQPFGTFIIDSIETPSSLSPKTASNETACESMETFSWLHCTRFKPPKLPRSKKRGNLGKRLGRGPRIPFSPHQIAVLESTFSSSQYLSSECINRLANALHLSETRVKIWFQNRRARFRREKDARDCHSQAESPHSGLLETNRISSSPEKDKVPQEGRHQRANKSVRSSLMTSPGHYLALQIQSRKEMSEEGGLRVPDFSGTYKNLHLLGTDFLTGVTYSSKSLMDDPLEYSLFNRPHPPLINDPMLSDFVLQRSETRLSANSISSIPTAYHNQTHPSRIY